MNNWIMPVNPKKFDIISYLNNHNEFVWKAKKHFKLNDAVYVYISSPIQEIRYKCVCVKESVDDETLNANNYAKIAGEDRYAQFHVIERYAEGKLKWAELHSHGYGQALLPVNANYKTIHFIEEHKDA